MVNAMVTWEYKVAMISNIAADDGIEDAEYDLNDLGLAGWEAVSVAPKMGPNESSCMVVMKRPRTEAASNEDEGLMTSSTDRG